MLARIIDFPRKTKANPQNEPLSAVLRFLNRICAIADQNQSFPEATRKIFAEVCTFTGWPIAHIYVRDEQNPQRYVSNAIWFLEDGFQADAIEEFVTISEDITFEAGKGLIGQIAEEQEARALEDVTLLSQFLRSDVAARNGVRGFFGFPIVVDRRCVAVAEFYSRQTGLLDPTSLEIMQYVSSQLARLFERDTHLTHQQHLINQYQQDVQSTLQTLVDGSAQLGEVAHGVHQQATRNNQQCTQVSHAQTSIQTNMDTLQTAVEDLIAIENQTQQSSTTVNKTVAELAHNISTTLSELKRLADLSTQIETIVQNVSDISAQVRMLGLNASIEAARAGEAGKGFAIVAGEIKSLAQQSEKSSQDISRQLGDIRQITGASTACMQTVEQSMAMLKDCTAQLGHAVSDQHRAADTMRASLQDAQGTFATIQTDIAAMTNGSDDLLAYARHAGEEVKTITDLSRKISTSSATFITALKA